MVVFFFLVVVEISRTIAADFQLGGASSHKATNSDFFRVGPRITYTVETGVLKLAWREQGLPIGSEAISPYPHSRHNP